MWLRFVSSVPESALIKLLGFFVFYRGHTHYYTYYTHYLVLIPLAILSLNGDIISKQPIKSGTKQ